MISNEGGTSDESMQKITKASADVKGAFQKIQNATGGINMIIEEINRMVDKLGSYQWNQWWMQAGNAWINSKSASGRVSYLRQAGVTINKMLDIAKSSLLDVQEYQEKINTILVLVKADPTQAYMQVNQAIRYAKLANAAADEAEKQYQLAQAKRDSPDLQSAFGSPKAPKMS